MATDPTNGPAEEMVRRLLSAVASGATDRRVDELIAAARAEAEGEIQAMLKSAIKATLLRRTVERLEDSDSELPPPGEAEATPHAPPLEPRAPPAPLGDVGCYVYAITRAGPVPVTAGHEAADNGAREEASLQAVRYEDVQAIVAPVPLEEFAAAGGGGRENDPQWLEARVLAHDRVVKSALSAGPVIPCRFCTVVRGAEDVRRLLAKHYHRIVPTLSDLEGKEEWGVKICARPRPAREAGLPAGEGGTGAGGGKAYLFARKRAAHERGNAERAERDLAAACHEALASAACEAATLPLRAKAAGREGKLLLNGTYLVSDVPAFHAAVAAATERYRPLGLSLELTGPWPPYNFVRLDLSGDLSGEPTPEVAA
jgi:hypothetical protein